MTLLNELGLPERRSPVRCQLFFNPTVGMDPNSPTGIGGTAGGGAGMNAGTAFAGLSLISTLFGAFSQQKAGQAQQQLMQYNAEVASAQAADAIKRGDVAASRRLTQTKQTIGAQRVGLAAQGVEVNSG